MARRDTAPGMVRRSHHSQHRRYEFDVVVLWGAPSREEINLHD